MATDRERIRFKGKVISACMRQNGSLDGQGANSFCDELYSEYEIAGKSLDECDAWLDKRLANTFLSMSEPPVWVEEEPDWPFWDGQPMVFVSQTNIDKGEVACSKLSPGETVYLFGARRPLGTGYEMEYRTVSQFENM